MIGKAGRYVTITIINACATLAFGNHKKSTSNTGLYVNVSDVAHLHP